MKKLKDLIITSVVMFSFVLALLIAVKASY